MGVSRSKILSALAGLLVGDGVGLNSIGALPDYNRTAPSRNGGKKSGAAAIKRAASKRRNRRRK